MTFSTMVNVENIRIVQNQPLLEKLQVLFDERFSFSSNDRVLKVIEIGCGPGDFALIFKDKYKERVQVTAIDPIENDIKLAKEKVVASEVDFQISDIFSYKSNVKYDLVLFTKSLHHCIPVDQAVKNGYDMLSDDGIFLAEEVYITDREDKDTTWFFDRMDLLRSAGCMKSVREVIENFQFSKSMMINMLDSSLPASKRWFRPHLDDEEGHGHGHGHSHAEEHHGHEHAHEHRGDNGHREHDQTVKIIGSAAVSAAIEAQFGKEKVTYYDLPYFYQFLSFCGLKSNEITAKVLEEFIKQEYNAISTKAISPLGVNMVAYKK